MKKKILALISAVAAAVIAGKLVFDKQSKNKSENSDTKTDETKDEEGNDDLLYHRPPWIPYPDCFEKHADSLTPRLAVGVAVVSQPRVSSLSLSDEV